MPTDKRARLALLMLPLALATWTCKGSSPNEPSGANGSGGGGGGGGAVQPAYDVSSFVSDVKSVSGAPGVRRTGSAPASSNGPSSTPSGNSGAINGGSNEVRIRSGASFQTVYMFVGGVTGNVGGHWQVPLAAPTTDTSLIVSFGTQLPVSTFDLVFGVAAPNGAIGSYSSIPIQKLAAASGEVQVSVSWDARSDVDLHVVDPTGEEIYWGNPASASGGELDLDSNASCDIDGQNNENVRWTRAPAGTFRVLVDYWSSCGVAQTNYLVTIRNGGTTQTYRGSFTGPGDQGGRGSGRPVATFNRAAGLTTGEAQLLRFEGPRRVERPRAKGETPTVAH
jgi:hypothetical protein